MRCKCIQIHGFLILFFFSSVDIFVRKRHLKKRVFESLSGKRQNFRVKFSPAIQSALTASEFAV